MKRFPGCAGFVLFLSCLFLATACGDPLHGLFSGGQGSKGAHIEEPPPPPATGNHRPKADAGPARTVVASLEVALDGTGSTDPDGDTLLYSWVLVSKPAMSGAELSTPQSPTPSFTPDRDGEYVFRLIVSDGQLTSNVSEVKVALDLPPGAPLGFFTTRQPFEQVGASFQYSAPAMDEEGLLYAGSEDGFLYAMDLNATSSYGDISGLPEMSDPVWRTDLGSPVLSSPALSPDGSVYVVTADGNLHSISRQGARNWAFNLGAGANWNWQSSPAVGGGGIIYVGSTDQNVYALSPGGEELWRCDVGGSVYSTPALGSDGMIYVSSARKLHALDAAGAKQWEFPLPSASTISSPTLADDGTVYVNDGKILHAVGPGGVEKWVFDIGSEAAILSPAVVGEDRSVYVLSYRKVYSLEGETGTKRWETTLSFNDLAVFSIPSLDAEGVLYVPGIRRLHAISPDGNELWQEFTWADYGFQAPVVDKGAVYCSLPGGVQGYKTTSSGLADGSWPKFKQDNRGTSCVP